MSWRAPALVLALLLGGCSHGGSYQHTRIPYASDPVMMGPMGVMRVDGAGNVLVAAENNRLRQGMVQSVAVDGKVNWKYVPESVPAGAANTPRIADLFEDGKRQVVACVNYHPEDRVSKVFARMHVLDGEGKLLSTNALLPPPNPHNGNVRVSNCWEHDGKLFVLGTIFGGLLFNPEGRPGAIYWLQQRDASGAVTVNTLFASGMGGHASVTGARMLGEKVVLSATGDGRSELVSIEPATGRVARQALAAGATLVPGSKRLKTVRLNDGRIEVSRFDDALAPLGTASASFDRENYLIAAFAPTEDTITIVASTLRFAHSRLEVIEADDALSRLEVMYTERWAPSAIFSANHARTAAGDVFFHYLQDQPGASHLQNNLYRIRKQ